MQELERDPGILNREPEVVQARLLGIMIDLIVSLPEDRKEALGLVLG